MKLDAVQSDKNTCSCCPEQRVDTATDIVRYIIYYLTPAVCHFIWLITMFHVKQFYLRCYIIGRLFVACPPTMDKFLPFAIHLVNNGVSRETILFTILHYWENVCCLPSFNRHLLVGLLHFGLRPVQLDRLRICPFQSRQRQQNISLLCAHKADLSFAKIPNCSGLVFIELNGVPSGRNNYLIIVSPNLSQHFAKIAKRAISLQKVHLWMDCGKRILWSWTQSKATKIRAAAVQSSVWTLQQVLPDEAACSLHLTGLLSHNLLQNRYTIHHSGTAAAKN